MPSIRLAVVQTWADPFVIKMARIFKDVRARWRMSKGWRYDATYTTKYSCALTKLPTAYLAEDVHGHF